MVSVLYFTATWCGPCKMFSPIVEEVCSAMNIPLQKIDAEQNQQLTAQYEVRSVPSLFIQANGRIVYSSKGVLPKTKLIDELQKATQL